MDIKDHNTSLRPQAKNHTLNKSQLKSLTDNLRLRLRYASLKVMNGWHNQTLNQIESTIYYPLLHNHSNQKRKQRQSIKKLHTTHKQKIIQGDSLSFSTSSGSSKSSEPHDPPTQIQSLPLDCILPQSPRPFDLPPKPSSPSNLTLDQSSSTLPLPLDLAQSNSDEPNPETAFLIRKSNFNASTTLTLPLKYSTPFKKMSRSGDQTDPFSTESKRFWPTRTLDCLSTSPIRFTNNTVSNRKGRKNSLERLIFRMTGVDSKASPKGSNRNSGVEEVDDLFKVSSMLDFHDFYKPASPSSSLFNPLQRSILDSSPAKKSFNSILNSVSPVRIRSHLHSQSYPHLRLARFGSNSLASPTPSRTQKPNLNKIFGSSLNKDDNDQQASKNSAQLLPEGGKDDDAEEEEEDKENWMDLDNTNSKPSPLKLRSSKLTSKLHPVPPPFPTLVNPSVDSTHHDDQLEDVVSGHNQIRLDDLDKMIWE